MFKRIIRYLKKIFGNDEIDTPELLVYHVAIQAINDATTIKQFIRIRKVLDLHKRLVEESGYSANLHSRHMNLIKLWNEQFNQFKERGYYGRSTAKDKETF